MTTDIISGGVVELKGKRYSVLQFNRTLNIAVVSTRWSGGGMITVNRTLERGGPTYRAVAAAYWAKRETPAEEHAAVMRFLVGAA